MGLPRWAGDILRNSTALDGQYSNAVVDWHMGLLGDNYNPKTSAYFGGTPISALGREGVPRGAAYASAASRYGAPLVGAGMGASLVGETTNAIFGGPEDGQQPGQLDVGGLTVASLVGAAAPSAGIALTNQYRALNGISPMQPGMRNRIGVSAAAAGGTMLANALGQAIF